MPSSFHVPVPLAGRVKCQISRTSVGASCVGVFAQQDVEVDLRDLFRADGIHLHEGSVDEHDFGLARILVFFRLLFDFLHEGGGGELSDIRKVALVPGAVQAGIGGLGSAQEFFLIKVRGLVGRVLRVRLLIGGGRGQRVPVKAPPHTLRRGRALLHVVRRGRSGGVKRRGIAMTGALRGRAATGEETVGEVEQAADNNDVKETAAVETAAEEERAEQTPGKRPPPSIPPMPPNSPRPAGEAALAICWPGRCA